MLSLVFVMLGTLSLALGIVGILVPGLPTTPFLILSAGLYLRSSKKMYNWMLSNRYVGSYLANYYNNKGMSMKMKIYAILIMWAMITCSLVFFIEETLSQILLLVIGGIGTIVMGFIVPTIKKPNNTLKEKK